jgi:ATP-dependent Clp protease protease subunit
MHPTSSGSQGYTEDVRIATREQERIQTQLFHLMGKHSGHSWKEIEEYFLRDKYMSAPEARDFGLIDEVMGDVSDVVMLNTPEISMRLFQPTIAEVNSGITKDQPHSPA